MSATFLHAWRRRAEVQLVDDRLAPWLYGIAANLCRRHLRGARRHRAALARLSVSFPEPDLADDVAHRLDEHQRAEQALRLLESLPERDQDLFILCVWEGLSYDEAALALGIPAGTVRSRLSRARSRLRWLLAEPTLLTGDERDEGASSRPSKGKES